MSSLDRRTFLASGLAGAAASLPAATAWGADAQPRPWANPIGVSTYSFWQFRRDDFRPIEKCLELAAELGFDGVEILKVQIPDRAPANDTLQRIKQRAFSLGLDLMGYSTHQSFVKPDAAERQKNVDATLAMIEEAYRMGIPTLRINTGRWGTTKTFDELMANKGIEPRLPGYSDDDGFKWVIDSIEKLIPKAQECGVTLGLENHWGLGRTAEGVKRIVDAIDSPWLQVTLDTGNFLEDPDHRQFKMLAPQAILMQAKTYYGGGTWYTLDIDYAKIAQIMQDAGYRGYVSLEFEGKADPIDSVRKSLAMLRQHFT